MTNFKDAVSMTSFGDVLGLAVLDDASVVASASNGLE
jgi:hypothetical protein